MPKVTITVTDENKALLPTELQTFITDNKVEVWVGDKVAEETNAPLVKNRDDILAEKNGIKDKYDALVKTSSADDIAKAKLLADAEAKVKTAIPESDQKILDAVKKASATATPEEIETAIKEYPTVFEKLSTIEKTKATETIFASSGYKNPKVFNKIFNDPELNPNFDSVIFKDEKDAQGNTVQVPYVKLKNAVDGKVEITIPEYGKANAEWNHYMPSLNAGDENPSWLPIQTNNNTPVPVTGQPANAALGSIMAGFEKRNTPKEKAAEQK